MRRCRWCDVWLRWWQIFYCRTCRLYINLGMPSPPCHFGARRYGKRDRFWGDYRGAWQ